MLVHTAKLRGREEDMCWPSYKHMAKLSVKVHLPSMAVVHNLVRDIVHVNSFFIQRVEPEQKGDLCFDDIHKLLNEAVVRCRDTNRQLAQTFKRGVGELERSL